MAAWRTRSSASRWRPSPGVGGWREGRLEPLPGLDRRGAHQKPQGVPGRVLCGLTPSRPLTASHGPPGAGSRLGHVGSQDGPTVAPPRPMAGGPGPGPGDPAAVAAAAAGRTLTWPRAGGRDPAEQGEAPPRTGYSPPRAEHSGRPGDATQGWGAPVVIVPRVRSLLLVLHFAFSLRSRLRRRAPALAPRAPAARPPVRGESGVGAGTGRGQSGSLQVRWIRRPVGFALVNSRRM